MKTINFLRREWLALLLLLVPTALTLFYWNQLPNPIAIHWGLNEEPNGYQSPPAFLWSTLAFNVFIYALLVVIPYLDPKKGAVRLEKPLRVMRIATMALMVLVSGCIVLKAVGYPIDVILIGNIGIILFFLVLGNLMAKFPPNYFAGIRTPWTLESPEVWRRVHQMASKLWVAGSLVLLLFVFRLDNTAYMILFTTITLVLVGVPMAHSYLLYQKLKPNNRTDD